MGRGARNALRLDALKRAFITNAPRSEAIDIGTVPAAPAGGGGDVTGVDASLAARQTNQKTKTAKARPQG